MIPTGDVQEAASIVRLVANMLVATSNTQMAGRAGSDLRRACGDLSANAETYIVSNQIGPKLSGAFMQARITGATRDEFDRIRSAVIAETVVSLLAALIQSACIWNSLQQMSIVIAGTTFTSRDDVEFVQGEVVGAFQDAEEAAADAMMQAVYQALVALHAAVVFNLYQTARPLPQMLDFQFAAIRPTLIQSYRLYADAGRADELRAENNVVHPAFAPRFGRALSF
jgi:prophage DNA circulation protein